VLENSNVEVIAMTNGDRIIPSVVSFRAGLRLIGKPAKEQFIVNPENTIFSIKRLMGFRYSDPILQNELKRLPYTVVAKDNHPYVAIDQKGKRDLYSRKRYQR
jgi:heat shock protein 5